MKRCQFRAEMNADTDIQTFLEPNNPALQERMAENGVSRLSLFQWESQLFVYYECPGESPAAGPHVLFSNAEEILRVWPGGTGDRYWAPMADIFHYQAPTEETPWRTPQGNGAPYGRLARLQPDMISSYIFYHYQYQEEKPGDGCKYGIISLHEDLMFFYSEKPGLVEKAPYRGKLSTANTPADWGALMDPHFVKWPDSRPWLDIPLVLHAEIEQGR
ncbi:hypothetical protein [Paenibacillus sp. YN15]|uniref:hypothetical protein n=1 Tax=Paenibacillus sp. YN15 TaxID=1742774 RepID=UPI0011BF464C|nr:hypothetical protein [Paenibacillus sp. YN15]